ncbi:hypothetical protein [Streptomyces rubellomurinus]|uniref:Uncharacterized protein n=1 Tax=Streptomyces rubellomurinus (strain ATCC 31215) TaxID=359131 RepID=A0A0F2TMN6_STRR3|nr:hypothetical protein [Streptomyces rubellomurinus]KJS63540.1 hypothetical protein VM95_01280 [Streptomyces rubellomurinus]
MDSMLGSMISFAATGEIGAFRIGMAGEEADRLLGGGTGLADGPVGFKDGSLEVWVDRDLTVCLLGYDAVDVEGRFARAGGQEPIEAPSREVLIDGLAQRGCAWRHEDALSFDDQLAIRTEAGVSVVFTRRAPGTSGWVTASLYRSPDRP